MSAGSLGEKMTKTRKILATAAWTALFLGAWATRGLAASTSTFTPSSTATVSPTDSPTATGTATPTSTPTDSPTSTGTPTSTPSSTITQTYTISQTFSASPTFSDSPTVTATPTTAPTQVVNGKFEQGSLAGWTSDCVVPAVPSTDQNHTLGGSTSALLGTVSGQEPFGFSCLHQSVTVAQGNGRPTLVFWYRAGNSGDSQDYQEMDIMDTSGNVLATPLAPGAYTQSSWREVTFDLRPYIGRTIRLYFKVFQDGNNDPSTTFLYVDDVSVTYPSLAPTDTVTPTDTRTSTRTPTPTGTSTDTGTATPTSTATSTFSVSPTVTPSSTRTPALSATASPTASPSSTGTPVYSATASPTVSPSSTLTTVVSATATSSATPSSTASSTATPSPTPLPAGCGALGDDAVESVSSNVTGLNAVVVTAAEPLSVSGMELYVPSTSGSGQIQMALYASNPGGTQPTTLIAATAGQTAVVGWNALSFGAPVDIPAGTYWLAFQVQSGVDISDTYPGSGTVYFHSYSYSSFPATFPTGNTAPVAISIFANFCQGPSATVTPTSTLSPTFTVSATATATPTVVPVTTQVQNGFTTGDFSFWTLAGQVPPPSIQTGPPPIGAGGTYIAQLGYQGYPPLAPYGDSAIYQDVQVSSNPNVDPVLQFWYEPFSNDSLPTSWQEAEILDPANGAVLAQVMKICGNSGGWQPASFDLSAYRGRTIRLYFDVHEDGQHDPTSLNLAGVTINYESFTPTATSTATPTSTPTSTATPTASPSWTSSPTGTASSTRTPSSTASPNFTATDTPTASPSSTVSPNFSATDTDTRTSSPTPTPSATPTLTVTAGPATLVGTGTGLTGTYYANYSYPNHYAFPSGPACGSELDPQVNFSSFSAPGCGSLTTDFFVRWTGYVQAQYGEQYTIYTNTDDGCRVWVSDASGNQYLVVDQFVLQGQSGTYNGSGVVPFTFQAGQKYAITMDYFQNLGGLGAQLEWGSAHTARELIPTSQLYPAAASASASNAVQNPGFEQGSMEGWQSDCAAVPSTPPSLSTDQAHGGAYSALLGTDFGPAGYEPAGDTCLYQDVVVPQPGPGNSRPQLTFWWYGGTQDSTGSDWQEVLIQNPANSATLATVMKTMKSTNGWQQVTYDLGAYAGQTVRVYFDVHQDGAGDPTYMYVDDVSVGLSTAQFQPSGQAKAVLAPNPALGGAPLTLYFPKAPASTQWDIYNVAGQRVSTLSFGSQAVQSCATQNFATGLYIVHVKVRYQDGSSEEQWIKAMVIK